MNRLLLITGDLAMGKSTFAEILSKRYNTTFFCKDTIKEALGDTIGFSSREQNLRLSAAAVGIMSHIFKQFGKLNKNLILEANFHETELDRLQALAEEMNYRVLTVELRGSTEELHKRYLHRMKFENRHPVHLSTTFDVYEDFKSYVENARAERIPGDVISVSSDDFGYQNDDELLKKLDEFMGKVTVKAGGRLLV